MFHLLNLYGAVQKYPDWPVTGFFSDLFSNPGLGKSGFNVGFFAVCATPVIYVLTGLLLKCKTGTKGVVGIFFIFTPTRQIVTGAEFRPDFSGNPGKIDSPEKNFPGDFPGIICFFFPTGFRKNQSDMQIAIQNPVQNQIPPFTSAIFQNIISHFIYWFVYFCGLLLLWEKIKMKKIKIKIEKLRIGNKISWKVGLISTLLPIEI